MDRNYITGIILLFVLFVVWYQINAPSAEEIERQQFVQDSIAQVEAGRVAEETKKVDAIEKKEEAILEPDSAQRAQRQTIMMGFEPSNTSKSEIVSVENNDVKVEIDLAGGQIKAFDIKNFDVLREDSLGNEIRYPVKLMDHADNYFFYEIPLANGTTLKTNQIQFEAVKKGGKQLILSAKSSAGGEMRQIFTLPDEGFAIDYRVEFDDLDDVVAAEADRFKLQWKNSLNKLEKNVQFEQMYSTVYFHEIEEGTDYCSCRGDDEMNVSKPIKWVSHANQFFSTNLIANTQFEGSELATIASEEDSPILKTLTSSIELPLTNYKSGSFDMTFYAGPNEFDRLRDLGHDLSDIVPFGWSIFGSINRWVIRPIFTFLSSFIGSMGIVILILTFLVKAAVFPLTYRMLYSQAKMAALKPVTKGIREKYKDDMQKQQMESMKIYREYGVNPMGGCMPMILQMPIWFALYRFFPASIEFRQASFLWANDLSTYDSFFNLPFSIPMMGSHISLFTLLWVISLLAYTWYNIKHNMDMSTAMNPMMKNMQFIMPVMFFVFLNQYAAGLTCYLLFSNLINIGQTVGTKNFLLDEEKIKDTLRANKEKPKKTTGFGARLQKALEEQKRIAEDQQQKKNRKR